MWHSRTLAHASVVPFSGAHCPKRTLGKSRTTAYLRHQGRAVRGLVSMASSRFETAGPRFSTLRATRFSVGTAQFRQRCGERDSGPPPN